MPTTTRTDIHRPASLVFDPQDYSLVAVVDLVMMSLALVAGRFGVTFARHQKPSHCGHCGAAIRYGAVLRHVPTGEAIVVGQVCLDNRFESLTKEQFQSLRKAAALDATRRRGQEVLDAEGLGGTFDTTTYAGRTLTSIAASVRKYGAFASERQRAFALRLLAEVNAPAAPAANARPVFPASGAQVAFIKSLVSQTGYAEAIDFDTLSKSAASDLIGALKALPKTAQTDAQTGYYVQDGEVYVVVENKAKTHTYAKHLVISGGRGRWIYAPGLGSTLSLSTPLTVVEASRLGHLHGVCVVCGAALTDPASVDRGIGPVCAKRLPH